MLKWMNKPNIQLFSQKIGIIASVTSSSPIRRQEIIWTNARIVLIAPEWINQWNLNQNTSIFSQESAFNIWCPKRRLICLGLGVQILLCDIALYRVYSKNYASGSPLIVCWSGLIRDNFTHIRESYFTAIGAFIRVPQCLLYRGKMSTWNSKTTVNWYEHHNQTTHTTKASAYSMRYTVLKCWPCSDVWLKFSTYFSF